MFSDLTRKRFGQFRKIKRAYFSFWILGVFYFLSLFSEWIANDKPLCLGYRGEVYFPSVKFYSSQTFGGSYKTEADYLELQKDSHFKENGGWMIFPLIPHSPYHSYLDLPGSPPHAPSRDHWLGTDTSARDVLTRLIYGFRLCMTFSLVLTLTSCVLGVVIGGVQGYFGGVLDLTFQRLIEVWASLPFLYIVILFGSIYGRSLLLLLLILTLFQWIGLSYFMRGEFLKTRSLNFVRVARALGYSHMRIFFREILPNTLAPMITLLPFMVVGGISSLTALDFLGFGIQPPAPSWGELLQQGVQNLQAPWIGISSVCALFLTLLLASFVGEGLREAFDPKSGQRLE